jgi:putative hydrolase of the HAD superfamily
MISAVFFDVDFTLIYPGPRFRGEGYKAFAAQYGMTLDENGFDQGVTSAASLLESPGELYNAEIFVNYAAHIIEQMGGRGERVVECAREIYDEWAACQHFEMYDDAPAALRDLAAAGLSIGLISNTHRCLTSFESHFGLRGLITAAVTSSEHGYMKPHPSIFKAALEGANVPASEAVMVGDSVRQDVEGALAVGMRAILIDRERRIDHPRQHELASTGVPVIHSLSEITNWVIE